MMVGASVRVGAVALALLAIAAAVALAATGGRGAQAGAHRRICCRRHASSRCVCRHHAHRARRCRDGRHHRTPRHGSGPHAGGGARGSAPRSLSPTLAGASGSPSPGAASPSGNTTSASGEPQAGKDPPGNKLTGCIARPSACGYPDATNSGVSKGTSLTAQAGDLHVTKAGTTIRDLALDGTIYVEAANTRIEDTEVIVNGTQAGCSSPCGGKGIWIKPGVSGTVIEDVTCHGGAPAGENVTEFCIQSNDASTLVERVHLYNCTTCMAGPGTWSDSFVDQAGATIPEEHYEDIYYGGGNGQLTVHHDTMLNPQDQTAVVFASVDFGDQGQLTITDNLIAGGGYMIYGGASGSGGRVIGPVTVTGNRFSRIYYPNGGSYGVDAYFDKSVTTWSGNCWDETLKEAPEE